MLLAHALGALVFLSVATAHAAPTCADPARTLMLVGPGACRSLDAEPAQCAAAWAVTQSGGQPVSCFYSPDSASCQGCGPTNQAAGVCSNACMAVAPAVPALGASSLVLLLTSLLGVGLMATRQPEVGR